ncbi:hypothetical protein COOONC_19063, partial [Cooperia oncophora]
LRFTEVFAVSDDEQPDEAKCGCPPTPTLSANVQRHPSTVLISGGMNMTKDVLSELFGILLLKSGISKEAGGIVEWVPNLVPYRGVLQPLFEEKGDPLPDAQWFTNWNATAPIEDRLEKMRSTFYRRYPLVMAEWFR